MTFKDPEGVAECTHEELCAAVERLWPVFFTKTRVDDFRPIVDGHWRVGFSLRLFGPAPDPTRKERRRAAWSAMEQLQHALEDFGFETTREGNAWQDGRLILGWAVAPDGTRITDLPEVHLARAERRARLAQERSARDALMQY
jgi:hypothetical protein